MSNARENVENKVKNMSFKDMEKNFAPKTKSEPKRSFLHRMLVLPFKFIGAMFGIDKNTVSSYRKSVSQHSTSENYVSTSNSSSTFREGYHFDPEQEILKRRAADAYMQLVDGRGDSEHCDCDHDHDR